MKKLFCATLEGPKAKIVEVESGFVRALPSFSIVGLTSSTIQESKERVKAALGAIGYKFPPMKITINLSPADMKKSGSHFDLPIALSIALQKDSVDFSDVFVFGELGLDGRVKETSTLFATLLSLKSEVENLRVLVPKESVEKVSKIPEIKIYAVESLREAIEFFKGSKEEYLCRGSEMDSPRVEYGGATYYYSDKYEKNFIEVIGQKAAKRAALVAAAGMHNILLEGSPGCGKSMIIERLREILPPMSMEEILEVAALDSLEGKQPNFEPKRPIRAPHHTSTKASIFGGGTTGAKIGEVALAHRGILFFDELPHFPKSVLEALREPLQNRRILISRVHSKVEYKSDFLFAAAQNPCPCGNLLSRTKECRCTQNEILKYKNRISEPLLERIDIYLQMSEISDSDIADIDSSSMHKKVIEVFLFQKRRGQRSFNASMSDAEAKKFCILDEEAREILKKATDRLALSRRSIGKILRLSRTVADLKQIDVIGKEEILEAIGYRKR